MSSGAVSWQKAYGASGIDVINWISECPDAGFIMAGYTHSFGSGNADFWVLKLTSQGAVTWEKACGGTGGDYSCSVQSSPDGGYIVGGATQSFGAGDWDAWVVHFTSTGDLSLQKSYGGAGVDWINSVRQTSDGGFIATGYTFSFGEGNQDYWALKLLPSGDCGALDMDTPATPIDTTCTVTITDCAIADTGVIGVTSAYSVTDAYFTVHQQAP